jgi:hypothetical protein
MPLWNSGIFTNRVLSRMRKVGRGFRKNVGCSFFEMGKRRPAAALQVRYGCEEKD